MVSAPQRARRSPQNAGGGNSEPSKKDISSVLLFAFGYARVFSYFIIWASNARVHMLGYGPLLRSHVARSFLLIAGVIPCLFFPSGAWRGGSIWSSQPKKRSPKMMTTVSIFLLWVLVFVQCF